MDLLEYTLEEEELVKKSWKVKAMLQFIANFHVLLKIRQVSSYDFEQSLLRP